MMNNEMLTNVLGPSGGPSYRRRRTSPIARAASGGPPRSRRSRVSHKALGRSGIGGCLRRNPLLTGALGGAVGTAAMDAVLYLRYRRGGGQQGPLEWEFSSSVKTWDGVSAPGLVGRRLLEGFLGRDVPDQWARSTQNVMHWATGMGWSAQFGAVAGSAKHRSWAWGLVLGPVVWSTGYVILPLAKIYKPMWDYDAKTLAKDLSAHLVYGVTTGVAISALAHHDLRPA
jgi:hypothetical protein